MVELALLMLRYRRRPETFGEVVWQNIVGGEASSAAYDIHDARNEKRRSAAAASLFIIS